MISAQWTGEIISDNDRLIPNKQRTRWVANPEYKAFKESMAWILRAEYSGKKPIQGEVFVRTFAWISSRKDKACWLKAAYDAIQLAGIVKNDKQITSGTWGSADVKPGAPESIHFYVMRKK